MNSLLPAHLNHLLHDYTKKDLQRQRYCLQPKKSNQVIIGKKRCLQFCSNDYLAITQHPKIKKALIEGVRKYGLGSGSSPLISGYSKAHFDLEEAFATFLKRDRALLFNSGYHANLSVLTTLANRNTVMISDKFCHASLIDGALLSRSQLYRYAHQDLNHAEARLKEHSHREKLLISESVFSIQGDITNVTQLASLATIYQALLIIDDAHGIGVLGENGGGICEYAQLSQKEVPCLITPLGKAFGSLGAIVSGHETLIDALWQLARSYRYSTSLPAAICHATLASLHIIQTENWRRHQLNALIHFFHQEATKRTIPLLSYDPTPIKSILIGSNKKAVFIQQSLLSNNIFVSCIRPPTVNQHSTCIRISLNCEHQEKDILYLLDRFQEICEKYHE